MINVSNLMTRHSNVFTKQQCKNIINWGLKNGNHEVPKTFDDSTRGTHRNAELYFMNNKRLVKTIVPYVERANKETWNVQLNFCEPLQMSYYKKGDFYTWHKDSFAKPEIFTQFKRTEPSLRKISFVIALNDRSEYEGGELQLATGMHDNKFSAKSAELYSAGDIAIFPSMTEHRVTEVTKGKRFTLVGWLHGPPFI